jgi:glucoamylase
MATFRGEHEAFGRPGIDPRWTYADKEGVGTAYAASSRIWFTLLKGIVTEIYYPTVDRPQLRDLQYLITDGSTFFHEERRDLHSQTERIAPEALGYRVTNRDPNGRYTIVKEIIADPHYPCILQETTLDSEPALLSRLRFYVLCAPHLAGGGWGNNAFVIEAAGRTVLAAEKDGTWLALGADVPFSRASCGYVGRSDGWTDLADNFEMDWEFDRATNGNVALTGELALSNRTTFTLGLALGESLHNAVTTLFQSLDLPFTVQRARFIEQWGRVCRKNVSLTNASHDRGHCYCGSYGLLMAHEDKTYPGAIIASLAIPWGEANGDEDKGGYHLVWTRDMVNSAMGLLAAGNTESPRRALSYLAVSQQEDGGFAQNFWIDGEPYWTGIQLDEVAFPILLASRLSRENALGSFDPYVMVMRAAGYLIRNGPATAQERWEELSGYSPSTLAVTIAALIAAGSLARGRGEESTARFLEEYADFLEAHLEAWTVTTEGTLVARIARHYIRIHPVRVTDDEPEENPNRGRLALANRPPGTPSELPAKEIVDAGFLELVRYGVRRPDDPLIVDSLQVVDTILKVDTPWGPCWHRYNHDGFGQRDDGGPYLGWGRGRAWPLLTGERGHYELAAGRDPTPYIRAMEGFARPTGLLPEQIWDEADRPESHLWLGRPTGAATPLMWAHAEYIKLLRSAADGQVFDCIPEVVERYRTRSARPALEIWNPKRRVRSTTPGSTLRVQAPAAFRIRWSHDEWQTIDETPSNSTPLGIEFVDIPVASDQRAPIRFTLFWPADGRWEGRDYGVAVEARD